MLRHDEASLAALRTLACGIAAAVGAGAVASKWGGYFGQEWLEPSPRTALAAPVVAPAADVAKLAGGAAAAAADVTAVRLSSLEAKVEMILARMEGADGADGAE